MLSHSGKLDVLGYQREFNRLSRYAGDEVSTEAQKMAMFRRGFSPELKYALTNIKADNFEELINIALKEEYGRKMVEESRKQSREATSSSANVMPPQKRRIWVPYATSTQPNYFPRPTGFSPHPPAPMFAPRGPLV